MSQDLPRSLKYRLEQLHDHKGKSTFHPLSIQISHWIFQDPEYGSLAVDLIRDYQNLTQSFEDRFSSHFLEAQQLVNQVQEKFPEKSLDQSLVSQEGIPTMAYYSSLQRARDLASKQDLLATAQAIEAPKFEEDRTESGQLISILWQIVSQAISSDNDVVKDKSIEKLYLDIDYLSSRQHVLVVEAQILLPAHPGGALQELLRLREALIAEPRQYLSLLERGAAMFQMPPHRVALLVGIRNEATGKNPPNALLHQQIYSLWLNIFNEIADRLSRPRNLRHAPALQSTRLLVMSANSATAPLWIEKEAQAIRDGLYDAPDREAVLPFYCSAATPQQLMPQLDQHRPHIWHFSGHGSEDSLGFVDEYGTEAFVEADVLLKVVQLAKHLRLVVLLACDSNELAKQLTEHVDAAIGMDGELSDADAPVFSKTLYRALAQNLPLQDAFDRAVLAVQMDGGEYKIPQINVRSGIDISTITFGRSN